MGIRSLGIICTPQYGFVLPSIDSVNLTHIYVVHECRWVPTVLCLLGGFSVIRLAFKTFYVLAQTFVLSGTNVSALPATIQIVF